MAAQFRWSAIPKFLYTHNPFYFISAALILYGLQLAFQEGSVLAGKPWALMGAICTYASLMAITGYAIVRWGKVWQDARSIVLVLLFLFLAISVSFDPMFNTSPSTAFGLLIFGLCFATFISEGLLRGLSIRFPILLRGPYYAILALFFVYPNWVCQEANELHRDILDWRIFLFPTVGGIVFLTLLPAIRNGSNYTRNNGTPWKWPLFPWTVFAFLAASVCFRSYVLSLSFQPAKSLDSAFGMYYLVPFFLSLLILLLEMGLVEKLLRLQRFVVMIAPGLLAMAARYDVGSRAYNTFFQTFLETAGSPLFATLVLLALFYWYCWIRGCALAESALTLTLLAAVLVDTNTLNLQTLAIPQPWPLFVLGGTHVLVGLFQKHSFRFFMGQLYFITALILQFQSTQFTMHYGVMPVHLCCLSLLLTGSIFRDRTAVLLLRTGLLSLPVFGFAAVFATYAYPLAEEARNAYLCGLIGISCVYWLVLRDPWCLASLCGTLVCGIVAAIWSFYALLGRLFGPRGLAPLLWGVASFIVAVLISILKAQQLPAIAEKRSVRDD